MDFFKSIIKEKEVETGKDKEVSNINISNYDLLDIMYKVIDDFIIKKPHIINEVQIGRKTIKELEKEYYFMLNQSDFNLNDNEKKEVFNYFKSYILGWGILSELTEDEDITDIKCIDYNNIRIKVKGKRRQANVEFRNREELSKFVEIIAIRNGGTLSEINAIQKLTDKTSSSKFIFRINISNKFVNSVSYPYLVIRKIPKFKKSLEQLKNENMINNEISEYLKNGVKAGLSMLFIGKGASGKTTLINALIDEIPFDKSGLVIQESEELFTKIHPDMMFQRIRDSKNESKIRYTLKDLAINGLLTDLDYFLIGEIKGEEAMDMINAIYTGHTGMSSLHGNSPREGMHKLIHYMKYSKFAQDMKSNDLLRMLSAIDTVIYMKDYKTVDITEIAGFNDKEGLMYNDVFKYEIKNNKGYFKKVGESCEKIKKKIEYQKFKKGEIA